MDIKIIFLSGLNEPKYSRIEFWQQKQSESGFSPVVFWRKLNEIWQQYFDLIESKIIEMNSWGNTITDYRLALLTETNMEVQGHIGKPELEDLHFSLFDYGFELKQNLWLYEYSMDNISTSKESSPAKQFSLFHSMNKFKFTNELKGKQPERISEFLDFHYRCYERKINNHQNKNGLLSEWIEHTRKHLPVIFSPKQKDAFLLWVEKTQQPQPKPNKTIKSPVIRLFCAIVHQSRIIEKGFDESAESYIKRVCKDFNIEVNPLKARQYFNIESDIKKTDKNLKSVIELILPNIPSEIKNKIEAFINSKIKLYG